MPIPPDLIMAYRAAVYDIDADGEMLSFQVDRPNRDLDAFMHRRGAATGVFITAYNPRSETQPEEANAAAHGALIAAVRRAGKSYVTARGRDAKDDGPTEAGLFVLDLARDDALNLARRFDQYGIVYAESGKAPALLLTQ